jgi:predicted RNA-binding protein with PUA-like domain
MAYWLVKSEPSAYSWQQLVTEGSTVWSGVRNYAARNNLRAMSLGDEAFFYHSNEGLCIVGIARVCRTLYPDPTSSDETWGAVDFEPVKSLKTPVTLDQMKADTRLRDLELLRIGRLSVSKVTADQWKIILELGKTGSKKIKK